MTQELKSDPLEKESLLGKVGERTLKDYGIPEIKGFKKVLESLGIPYYEHEQYWEYGPIDRVIIITLCKGKPTKDTYPFFVFCGLYGDYKETVISEDVRFKREL